MRNRLGAQSSATQGALTDSELRQVPPGTRTIEDIISEHQKLAKLAMETTDAFRARFAENYYQLLLKKGVDPSTARARARAKAAALPARIETPAAAPAPALAAPPAPVAATPAPPAPAPAPAIKREAPSSDESEDDDDDESDDDAVPCIDATFSPWRLDGVRLISTQAPAISPRVARRRTTATARR